MSDGMIPIYVTRQTEGGTTGSFSVNLATYAVLMVLLLANMIGWGVYGIVALYLKFVGLT